MTEAATVSALVVSPCIGICRMSADGSVCEGCLRTLDEIAAWGGASDEAKRAILHEIALRRTQRG